MLMNLRTAFNHIKTLSSPLLLHWPAATTESLTSWPWTTSKSDETSWSNNAFMKVGEKYWALIVCIAGDMSALSMGVLKTPVALCLFRIVQNCPELSRIAQFHTKAGLCFWLVVHIFRSNFHKLFHNHGLERVQHSQRNTIIRTDARTCFSLS